jgi:hypothetical protein
MDAGSESQVLYCKMLTELEHSVFKSAGLELAVLEPTEYNPSL